MQRTKFSCNSWSIKYFNDSELDYKRDVSKNNKLEAGILDIEEYERLHTVSDTLEDNEIKQMLAQRSKEELEVSHSKIISIEV